jgi:hypothetical protein
MEKLQADIISHINSLPKKEKEKYILLLRACSGVNGEKYMLDLEATDFSFSDLKLINSEMRNILFDNISKDILAKIQ